MATKAPAKPAAPASKSSIARKKRNALERKCLPKTFKVLFSGNDRTTFKTLLAAWKDSRRKVSLVVAS